MQDKEQDNKIQEIVRDFIGEDSELAKTSIYPWFTTLDTSKPNIHDNKKDFLLELDAVKQVIEGTNEVLRHILPSKSDTRQETMTKRLGAAIDKTAMQSLGPAVEHAGYELALDNIVQTGFHFNSMHLMLKMVVFYEERLRELEEQQAEFWDVTNRPPNHYARTIALRLARLYAQHHYSKPTFGTSRDGGHPSTEFGRALEQIYLILDIDARVPNAAKWAVDQLTEKDLEKPKRKIFLGDGPVPKPKTSTHSKIIQAIMNPQEGPPE